MNTENKSARLPGLTSALSVLFFWALMACIMLLLARQDDSGMGNGSGSGNGASAQAGSGNDEAGDGNGASAVEAGGADTAKGEGKAEEAKAEKGEGEGDREKQANEADDAQKDSKGTAGNDGTVDGDGGNDEETVVTLPPEQEPELGRPNKNNPPQQEPDKDARKQTVKQGGKTTLTGSEAGKMKGFFGSGKMSGRVVFLLDVSGSMMGNTPEAIARLDLLKRELKKVLMEKLDANKHPSKKNNYGDDVKGHFMIVTFSDNTIFYPKDKKMLSFNKEKDLKDAIDYVDSLRPCGGTNMKQAWEECLDVFKKQDIDWVYFLSDGEPGDCCEQELLSKLKGIKPRVNTFSLGVKSTLMENVAKQHRGHYWEIY